MKKRRKKIEFSELKIGFKDFLGAKVGLQDI